MTGKEVHAHAHAEQKSPLQEHRELGKGRRTPGRQAGAFPPKGPTHGIRATNEIPSWKYLEKEFSFDVVLSLQLVAALLDNALVLSCASYYVYDEETQFRAVRYTLKSLEWLGRNVSCWSKGSRCMELHPRRAE